MTLTLKNEPLELISGAALNLPTKFGEDRSKDLGEVGEQTEKTPINLTFDLDDLDLSKNEGPGRSRGTNRKNQQHKFEL